MNIFEAVRLSENDEEAVRWLVECTRVSMKQFYPSIKTTEDVEDTIDLPTIYELIDLCAGIKLKEKTEETIVSQSTNTESSWEALDLAKLESEVFLLGMWKDYNELEISLSMPELVLTLEAKRDLDYQGRKFMAAIQGVELEEPEPEPDALDKLKARVYSKGQTSDPNDILALQGPRAAELGFGIGMGMEYEKWD